MFYWLKKHFIPHEGNEHRPHILRGRTVRNIVIIILLLEIVTFLIPTITHINTTGNMASVLSSVLSDLTNEERNSQSLAVLSVNPTLTKAAELKALDMAQKSYFAHTSPEGKTPWSWLEQVGYQYQYAGENLAVNFNDSKDVTDAWMHSPTHRANIIKNQYTEVGTGLATGIYEGKEAIFVAQLYAKPLSKIIEKNTITQSVVKENKNVIKSINKKEPTGVLGAEIAIDPDEINNTKSQTSTFWQKLFASPRYTTNIILYIFFGVIYIALLLYIVIKMKNHHKDLITNGLIVLGVLGAIFLINYFLSYKNMKVLDSVYYSNVSK